MEIDNVVGIKDSSLNNYAAKKVLASGRCDNYFTALSLFLPRLFSHGARRAICPLAAVHPSSAYNLYQACDENTSGLESSAEFRSLLELLPIVSNPTKSTDTLWRLLKLASSLPYPVLKAAASPHSASKEALKLQGIPIQSTVRAPLPEITLNASNAIKMALQRAGISVV